MRSDVPGGWHHGDDIFSPLGQPVVAVADGKVYKVGWNRVGGWRLWLRDAQGNRFYYAHLSGYTKYGRNGTHVKAGQQIAFIGNTGDAFTTPHHLHFEIHPARLLYLHYAGAVDPTTYLDQWRRVEHVTPLRADPASRRRGDARRRRRHRLPSAARGPGHPAAALVDPVPAPAGRPADSDRGRCGSRVHVHELPARAGDHRRPRRVLRRRRARGVAPPPCPGFSRLRLARAPGGRPCAGCAARRRYARRDRTRTRSS